MKNTFRFTSLGTDRLFSISHQNSQKFWVSDKLFLILYSWITLVNWSLVKICRNSTSAGMDIFTFNPLKSLRLKHFRFLNLPIYIGFPWLPLRITSKLPIIAKKSYWPRRNKETVRELRTSFRSLLTIVFHEYAPRHLFQLIEGVLV